VVKGAEGNGGRGADEERGSRRGNGGGLGGGVREGVVGDTGGEEGGKRKGMEGRFLSRRIIGWAPLGVPKR